MRSLSRWSAAVALTAGLSVPASAQIISTSVPKDISGKTEKKWSLHLMASPYAKWQINDFVTGFDCADFSGPRNQECALTLKLNRASRPLLVAEVAFNATESLTLTAGGWFNKLGTSAPELDARLAGSGQSVIGGSFPFDESDHGNISEFHLGLFYKSFGIQGGTIMVSKDLFFEQSRTDSDFYFVLKPNVGKVGVSAGVGAYRTGKFEVTDPTFGLISADAVSRLSAFGTVSVPVVKGLSVDGSFWWINKSSGAKDLGLSDGMARFMIGVGYSL